MNNDESLQIIKKAREFAFLGIYENSLKHYKMFLEIAN